MTEQEESIFQLFKTKSTTKQEVYRQVKTVFGWLREILDEICKEYGERMGDLDSSVKVEAKTDSEFEARITFGGDVLIFHMHTNVFSFEDESYVWKTSYVEEDDTRAFCGVINIYNFLADSFKYNRENDLGYLVSRLFINKEKHFFLEGKGDLGHRYSSFSEGTINREILRDMVEASILYALKFDLQTPPYNKVQVASVFQMQALGQNHRLKTGKRLGFKFNWESEGTTMRKDDLKE